MRKLAAIVITFVLILSLAACGSSGGENLPELEESPEASTIPSSTPEPSDDPRLGLIEIEMDVDEATSQVIITVKNGSDSALTCFVQINIKSNDKSIKRDTMYVEDLPAGQITYARIDIDSTENISVETKITSPEFAEPTDPTSDEYNEAASEELWEHFNDNFGTPGMEAEWFAYVSNVSIYEADPGYIVVTVNGGSDEDINRIGNTIYGNYIFRNEDGLGLVIVQDADGNELWRREL